MGVSRRPPPPGFGGGVQQRDAIEGSGEATRGGATALSRMIHFIVDYTLSIVSMLQQFSIKVTDFVEIWLVFRVGMMGY